ncbi:hypothetical protein WJX73_000006 [Symbiochloris irregularis]|uniref:Uncharacterized protein n=1 Tax=Symbiochloris irregularis TaxID=706552 RepID=A0AAW1NS80_9CHLO
MQRLRRIAALELPPRHPVRNSLEVGEIRAALKAFALSQANLRAGQIQCQLHIPRVIGSPKFAPNGQDFAVVVDGYQGPASLPMYVEGFGGGPCLMVFLEDGTCTPLMRFMSGDNTGLRDIHWTRDGQSLTLLFLDRNGNDATLRSTTAQISTGVTSRKEV